MTWLYVLLAYKQLLTYWTLNSSITKITAIKQNHNAMDIFGKVKAFPLMRQKKNHQFSLSCSALYLNCILAHFYISIN